MGDLGVKADKFFILLLYLPNPQLLPCCFGIVDQNINDLFAILQRKGLAT
jgi:hypothetical protein